jgi:hypothetical protein
MIREAIIFINNEYSIQATEQGTGENGLTVILNFSGIEGL